MSCNATKQYGSQSQTTAGLKGAGLAVGGLFGLGGFWSATDTSSLSNITQDFDDLKQKLDEQAQQYEGQFTAAQENFQQTQMQLMQSFEEFNNDLLDDKIEINSLQITIIFSILIVVIIYLVIL
jgi:hypothetical protein